MFASKCKRKVTEKNDSEPLSQKVKTPSEGSTARHDSVMSVEDEDEQPDKTSESDVSIQDQEKLIMRV